MLKIKSSAENYDYLLGKHMYLNDTSDYNKEPEQNDLLSGLFKSYKSLTSRQREAIFLRFYKNQSCKDIAKIMGMNTQSVYNIIHRSLTHMKKKIIKKP